jgi:hypothetical protein
MGKRTKVKMKPIGQLPTPEQLANDDWDTDLIMHAETATFAKAYRKREKTGLELWMKQGGIGYDEGALRAIQSCQQLWACMGNARVTARYDVPMPPTTGDDGWTAQEASDEMARRKKAFPRAYWDVFENVVRHGEPAGVAGSRLANNRPQQFAAAKTIVGMVASMLAARLNL